MKITLNELRKIVRSVLKEETEQTPPLKLLSQKKTIEPIITGVDRTKLEGAIEIRIPSNYRIGYLGVKVNGESIVTGKIYTGAAMFMEKRNVLQSSPVLKIALRGGYNCKIQIYLAELVTQPDGSKKANFFKNPLEFETKITEKMQYTAYHFGVEGTQLKQFTKKLVATPSNLQFPENHDEMLKKNSLVIFNSTTPIVSITSADYKDDDMQNLTKKIGNLFYVYIPKNVINFELNFLNQSTDVDFGKIGSDNNIPNVPRLEIGKIYYISIT
jgi:hypothetical protein